MHISEKNEQNKTFNNNWNFYYRLLHAQASYCSFVKAAETYELALSTIQKLNTAGYTDVNHAALYAEFSVLFFIRSEYDQAYK